MPEVPLSELDQIRKMTPKERYEARTRTSMNDLEHLVTWLRDTGRSFLILNAEDLVRGMGLSGVAEVQNLLAHYRERRAVRPSGRVSKRLDKLLGVMVDMREQADDRPTIDELCEVFAQVREQLRTEAPDRLAALERA